MTRNKIWAVALALLLAASVASASQGERGKRGPTVQKNEDRASKLRVRKQQQRFQRWLARQGDARYVEEVGDEYVDVIVVFNRRPTNTDTMRLSKEKAFHKSRRMARFPVREVRIRRDRVAKLRLMPNVRDVIIDRPLMGMSLSSREAANEPGYGTVNDAFTGAGVTVAVVDSGVAAHQDLPDGTMQFDFTSGGYPRPVFIKGELAPGSTSDPLIDGWGHGTHVAGIIAGDGDGSNGTYRGLAPGATIVSLRVLDDQGRGNTSDLIAALDWVLNYKDDLGIGVVNMSLGKAVDEDVATDPLVLAAQALWESGVVVVCAAGNLGHDGNFTIVSPGNSPHVITVGSLTDAGTGMDFADDYVSSFSSRGPTHMDNYMKPDILAPGNRVVAAVPDAAGLRKILSSRVVSCDSGCGDDYLEMSGTSMATPMVAATAARMLEKEPTLTPDSVKARLMQSAYKVPGDPTEVGAGVLDVDAAMYAMGTATSALSPKMIIDSVNGTVSIQDPAAVWGGDTTWDAADIYAAGYLWSDAGVEANGYLWSDGGLTANGYLWGDDAVHANGYLWGDRAEPVRASSFLSQQPDGSYVLLDD